MTLHGRRLTLLQTSLVALAVFAFGFSTTVTFGTVQSRSYSRPAVTVLGAGTRLSVLVTDGSGRLLLASGDDPAAFGNALAQIRPLGRDRIDVLLLAGSTTDLTFLSRARRAVQGRHVEAIGKPDVLGALDVPTDALLISPRRFRLSDDTSVTVETVDRADASDGPGFAWRATIEHRTTRIVVLSDGRVAAEFPDAGPVSALIVNGDKAIAAVGEVETRVFVASAIAVSGKQVRTDLAASLRNQTWVVRVFAGDAKRFGFTDVGLELPTGAVSIEATPHVSK